MANTLFHTQRLRRYLTPRSQWRSYLETWGLHRSSPTTRHHLQAGVLVSML